MTDTDNKRYLEPQAKPTVQTDIDTHTCTNSQFIRVHKPHVGIESQYTGVCLSLCILWVQPRALNIVYCISISQFCTCILGCIRSSISFYNLILEVKLQFIVRLTSQGLSHYRRKAETAASVFPAMGPFLLAFCSFYYFCFSGITGCYCRS